MKTNRRKIINDLAKEIKTPNQNLAKLKTMIKQDTYKDMFRGFSFFLFKWSISDWRNCELSIPRLIYYYPDIAYKLFKVTK